MSILIALAPLVLLVLWRLLPAAYGRYRARTQLRGDWWCQFERDLRQYMSQTWSSAREAERRL